MELDREQEQWHNITVIATQRGMSDLLPSGAQSSTAHQSNLSLKALPAVGNTKCVVKMIESLCKFFNISVSLLFFSFFLDNPNLVSRVVVAIETLDQNDNAPELDRQYTTSVCDSSAPGQVCSCFVFACYFI